MKEHFLYPGQLAVFSSPMQIKTLLGSCIAVALWDGVAGVSGMCHYLLVGSAHRDGTGRYGEDALPLLMSDVLKRGAKESRLRASVFGGASVMQVLGEGGNKIGQANIVFADKFLRHHNIAIVQRDVGGLHGRWILFDSTNGTTSCRKTKEGAIEAPAKKNPTKVLLVDDSAMVRGLFCKVLKRSPAIEVVDVACDAYDARDKIQRLRPDVLTLDLEMPRMNGVDFLAKLMKYHPMPVVVVSSLGKSEAAAKRCLELGAVEFLQKPTQFDPLLLKSLAESLIPKVLAAGSKPLPTERRSPSRSLVNVMATQKPGPEVIAIGGNIGAARSFAQFVERLAPDTPPVVACLPTVSDFALEFIKGLTLFQGLEARVATVDQHLRAGMIYLLPAGMHAKLEASGTGYRLRLWQGERLFGQCPAYEHLLLSGARNVGHAFCGILLGGFGKDGVRGLLAVRQAMGTTIVESPASASYPFAPEEAISLGAADYVSNPHDMAGILLKLRNLAVSAGSKVPLVSAS